jgi:hypothetical protein
LPDVDASLLAVPPFLALVLILLLSAEMSPHVIVKRQNQALGEPNFNPLFPPACFLSVEVVIMLLTPAEK